MWTILIFFFFFLLGKSPAGKQALQLSPSANDNATVTVQRGHSQVSRARERKKKNPAFGDTVTAANLSWTGSALAEVLLNGSKHTRLPADKRPWGR